MQSLETMQTTLETSFAHYEEALPTPDDTISLFSAQMLAIPSVSINISLTSFLTGLAVYLAFLWTRNLDSDAGPSDSRNVFVIFMVFVFVYGLFYWFPNLLKSREILAFQLQRRFEQGFRDLRATIKSRSDNPPESQNASQKMTPSHAQGTSASGAPILNEVSPIDQENALKSEQPTSNSDDVIVNVDDSSYLRPPQPKAESDLQPPCKPAASLCSPKDLVAALERLALLHDKIAHESQIVAEKYRGQVHELEE